MQVQRIVVYISQQIDLLLFLYNLELCVMVCHNNDNCFVEFFVGFDCLKR
jgi:hypothetical protein